jgi:hypothetical protein
MKQAALGGVAMILCALSACDRAPAPTPAPANPAASQDVLKPVATVKQVMAGITVPASNAVFAVAGEAPADDAGWQSVETSALTVAESANLLLIKPRAIDDQEWRQYSLALIDAGLKAAQAAQAKNADAVSIAGDDMYNVCEQCHAKYKKKP